MKITNLRSESYQWPKPVVVTSGRGKGGHQYLYNRLTLVYIETDEGLTGIGSGMRVEYLEADRQQQPSAEKLRNHHLRHRYRSLGPEG